jgi:hypothetical protein
VNEKRQKSGKIKSKPKNNHTAGSSIFRRERRVTGEKIPKKCALLCSPRKQNWGSFRIESRTNLRILLNQQIDVKK